MVEHPDPGNPFEDLGMSTLSVFLIYTSSYADIMLCDAVTDAFCIRHTALASN
jgi:hypothetical protein